MRCWNKLQKTIQFTYDALGRRIRKTDSVNSSNTIVCYYNNNWQVLCEYNSSGVYKRSFIYGNYIDEVLMIDNTGPSFIYCAHDHLYSPVALVGTNGTALERYEYDAYGTCQIMDGSYNPRSISSHGNSYLFTGGRVDALNSGFFGCYARCAYYWAFQKLSFSRWVLILYRQSSTHQCVASISPLFNCSSEGWPNLRSPNCSIKPLDVSWAAALPQITSSSIIFHLSFLKSTKRT